MAKAVFCITETDFQAETIVTELKAGGFLEGDISALLRDTKGNRNFSPPPNAGNAPTAVEHAGKAGTLSSAFGWLAGMDVLSIPGSGSFIATGPILSALRASTVGAGVGGIARALAGMGLPEPEARRFEGKIRSGNIFISVRVNTSDEAGEVKEIFEACRGRDVAIAGELPSRAEKPE